MLFVMLGWTRLWQSSIDFFVNQLVNFARRSRNNHNEFITRRACASCSKSDLGGDSPEIE
jgi:hypothetical protein